jgi:hypothetical protein
MFHRRRGSQARQQKNESAPDSISRRTLVRTALPRGLLTTSLRSDCTVREGLGWAILENRQIYAVQPRTTIQALPRTVAAPMIIRSSHRLHHPHLPFFGRLPLHLLPRLALAAGAHLQVLTDQKGLSRGILDDICSCPMVRTVAFGIEGTAVQSSRKSKENRK